MSDIQALFQKDPLQLTKTDISDIIAYYREKRNAFNLGDKTAGATKKMKNAKATGEKITDISDILNDL